MHKNKTHSRGGRLPGVSGNKTLRRLFGLKREDDDDDDDDDDNNNNNNNNVEIYNEKLRRFYSSLFLLR